MAQCKSCGEDIDFVKTGELKEDGKPKWRLVNPVTGAPHVCRGKQRAASTTITPSVLSGILVDIVGGGVLVKTEQGDRTYPLPKNYEFSPRPSLPQAIEYTIRHDGCIVIMKLDGPAEVPAVKTGFQTATEIKAENGDRMDGPANGECITPPGGQLIRPPTPAAVDNSVVPSPAVANKTVPVTTMHKERLIVLQSSLKAAVDLYFNIHGGNLDNTDKAPAIVLEWAIFFARGILAEAANPGE